jgi:hypothetical protein
MGRMVGLRWSPDSTPAQRWCVGILALVVLGLLVAVGWWPFIAAVAVFLFHRALVYLVVAVVKQDRSQGSPGLRPR